MAQQFKKIDYTTIDCESNYFNSRDQILLKNTLWFVDSTSSSKVSGSFSALGFFSEKKSVRAKNQSGPTYPIRTTEIDSSGNSRNILSNEIDFQISSSIKYYKNGVELIDISDWTSGLVKISAGTAGHIFDPMRYGATTRYTEQNQWMKDVDKFNPVIFVTTGGDPDSFTYPLITDTDVLAEDFNGVIEPLSIRSISSFSLLDGYSVHSTRGQFGNGNVNWRGSSDSVLSVDYRDNKKSNKSIYLDLFDGPRGLPSNPNLGSTAGWFLQSENMIPPFEDFQCPRGSKLTQKYDAEMLSAIIKLPPGGDTYVSENQISSTCGFVYDNAIAGTDSIAYGGLLY